MAEHQKNAKAYESRLRQKEMYLFGAAEQWKLELGFNAKIVGSCQVGT
jgi:hypothetical protein